MLDLADIHAAAMGIAEEEGPNVLHTGVEPLPPDVHAIMRENAVRKRRIRKAMMFRRAELMRPKVPVTTG